MNGCPRYVRAIARWFAGLELVVEFVPDPLADLIGDRARVDPGRDHVEQLEAEPQVLHVGVDRLGDPRVLDLDRDGAAVLEHRPVDLPDRRGGDRLLVEVGERLAQRRLEVLFDHLLDRRERDRLGVMLETREDLLELGADLLRHQSEVDGGQRLADLHRGAPHAPEHLDERLRGLELLARGRRPAGVRATAAEPDRPRSRLPRGDAGGRAGHARGAADARSTDFLVGHCPRLLSSRRSSIG